MSNLVFLLDITGSMSNELEGVKQTIARLVASVFTEPANTTAKEDALLVTVITFTEDGKDCYVTCDSFANGEAAVSFVNGIELCVPPNRSDVNASGGDGPENHKAALATLLTLDASLPTIAFLITDAIPHLQREPSTEAAHEVRFLASVHALTRREDTDLFAILAMLETHFQGRLVLSVIKYYAHRGEDQALYGAVAKRFNGVLITPQVRSADQLAGGLMAIISQLFSALLPAGGGNGSMAPTPSVATTEDSALAAFAFYDLSAIEIPASEGESLAIAVPTVGATSELLFDLVERTTRIIGDRFQKRAITAFLVNEQVELLLVVAKGMLRAIPADEAMERAELLLTKIHTQLTDEHRSQFKLTLEALHTLLADESFATERRGAACENMTEAVSAITLMSIEETARSFAFEEGDEEGDHRAATARDPYEALLTVASLFLGHLAVLQLPTRLGVPDFMDSWSAVVHKVANDVVSGSDFLRLIGSDDAVAGLSIRDRDYNFVQLVADPQDALGTALLRVASGTQILDILSALFAGAPPGLFSPNMFRGTSSACLMTLLATGGHGEGSASASGAAPSNALSQYQVVMADKMVHTLRSLMGPGGPSAAPSAAVSPSSSAPVFQVEPESSVAKLLFGLLRRSGGPSSSSSSSGSRTITVSRHELRLFLEEVAAERVQKFAKYSATAYRNLVEQVVGYEHVGLDSIVDVFAPHVLVDGDSLPFDGGRAVNVLAASSLSQRFRQSAQNVVRAVYSGSHLNGSQLPTLEQIWPSFADDLVKLVLLQKRTERYTLTDVEGGTFVAMNRVWVRSETVALPMTNDRFAKLALSVLQDKYVGEIREVRARREDQKREQQWREVLTLFRAPYSEFVARLPTLVRSDASYEYKLLRRAFRQCREELPRREYHAKLFTVLSGRVLQKRSDAGKEEGGEEEVVAMEEEPEKEATTVMTEAVAASWTCKVVFNRGNVHAHPDRFVKLAPAFEAKLRALQRTQQWPLWHQYRPSDVANHSGHHISNPSVWAKHRSMDRPTFWESENEC